MLLCTTHLARYVTDDGSRRVQTVVWKRATGAESSGLRFARRTFRFFVPFSIVMLPFFGDEVLPERFPLALLFRYHARRFFRRWRFLIGLNRPLSSDEDTERRELIRSFEHLEQDFAFPTNNYLLAVRYSLASLRDVIPSRDEREYELEGLVRRFGLFPASRFVLVLTLALATLVASHIISRVTGFRIATLVDLRPLYLGTLLVAGYGWAYGGLRFIQAIGPAARAALANRLYDAPEANAKFLNSVFAARAALMRLSPHYYRTLGATAVVLVQMFLIRARGLTWLEAIDSGLLNLPAILLCVSIWMQYQTYADVDKVVWHMPKSGFHVSVWDLDGKLGLTEMNELIGSYAICNTALLLIVTVLVPMAAVGSRPWWAFGLVALIGLAVVLPRHGIRDSVLVTKQLSREVKANVKRETSRIDPSSFADANARHEFLSNLRYRPFGGGRLRPLVGLVIVTCVIPIAIDLATKNWPTLKALLAGVLRVFSLLVQP